MLVHSFDLFKENLSLEVSVILAGESLVGRSSAPAAHDVEEHPPKLLTKHGVHDEIEAGVEGYQQVRYQDCLRCTNEHGGESDLLPLRPCWRSAPDGHIQHRQRHEGDEVQHEQVQPDVVQLRHKEKLDSLGGAENIGVKPV
ncbi:hypothetical protein JTE90_003472 [Oedothorax gibbosus]|uniref:Uncharacterized protein n=1 Tax=Oedothorax gibbosus TaxID=931172 RepID=A0AAV6U3U9_9ARAC|nr:hypothetical protein JTE90_003472 [Oedothorax gibbosus]